MSDISMVVLGVTQRHRSSELGSGSAGHGSGAARLLQPSQPGHASQAKRQGALHVHYLTKWLWPGFY